MDINTDNDNKDDKDDKENQINGIILNVKQFIDKENSVLYNVNSDINPGINTICIYEPIQYNYLWKTSWLFLGSTCYAICYQTYNYEFIITPGSIFLTSINYWKNPIHDSWERNLDVLCVFVSIGYNIIRSIGATYANVFYIYLALGFSSYLLSNYNHRRKRLYMSAFLHSLVHLYCNIALIYLYSGNILPTLENPVLRFFWNMCEDLVE